MPDRVGDRHRRVTSANELNAAVATCIEAAQAENAVSQFSLRQGMGHCLGKRVTMLGLDHQPAVEEDEFHCYFLADSRCDTNEPFCPGR